MTHTHTHRPMFHFLFSCLLLTPIKIRMSRKVTQISSTSPPATPPISGILNPLLLSPGSMAPITTGSVIGYMGHSSPPSSRGRTEHGAIVSCTPCTRTFGSVFTHFWSRSLMCELLVVELTKVASKMTLLVDLSPQLTEPRAMYLAV